MAPFSIYFSLYRKVTSQHSHENTSNSTHGTRSPTEHTTAYQNTENRVVCKDNWKKTRFTSNVLEANVM